MNKIIKNMLKLVAFLLYSTQVVHADPNSTPTNVGQGLVGGGIVYKLLDAAFIPLTKSGTHMPQQIPVRKRFLIGIAAIAGCTLYAGLIGAVNSERADRDAIFETVGIVGTSLFFTRGSPPTQRIAAVAGLYGATKGYKAIEAILSNNEK